MARSTRGRLFHKVLLPLIHGCEGQASLRTASAIAAERNVLLVGIVGIPKGDSLSKGALPARELRRTLHAWAQRLGFRAHEQIRVSENPWQELVEFVKAEQPELLILEAAHIAALGISLGDALQHPPCNVAVASGQIPEKIRKVLVPIRGGPSAELALRLGLSIARQTQATMNTIHVLPKTGVQDTPFRGIERVLKNLPEVGTRQLHTDNPAKTILSASKGYDVMIMGASARPLNSPVGLGAIAQAVLKRRTRGTIIVKRHHPLAVDLGSAFVGQTAISVLVDKWFAENTFDADEFGDLEALLALKRRQRLTVSLALPALNEQATVGKVIRTIKTALMDKVPLLDEIVLMDSNSTDRTREIAARHGIPVHIHQRTLANHGSRPGKGEALWKSLYVTRGDIILWLDTDIVNIHPRFIYGLLGPLLLRPSVQFIKGYYQRPLKVDGRIRAGGGGRVTELTARPMLNLFYPELSGMIQPLSGEYGGRREALARMPFSSGYGVEIGLLIDLFEAFGLEALAQVDLRERIHHNQPLESLSKMSFAIIQTVVRRLERRYERNILEDVNKTMKLIRYEQGNLALDVNEIAELERPAMMELPEYRRRFKARPARKYRSKA